MRYLFVVLAAALAGLGMAAPEAGAVRRNPVDGAEIVWVPAGPFDMGVSAADVAAMLAERRDWKAEWFRAEQPRHTVTLDGYWMYRCEVTVAQYRAFCDATGRKMPKLKPWSGDNHPVVNVTWFDAVAYAEWAGAHLPTEAQWEKAARGTDSRRFPWGDKWNDERCNNFGDSNPAGGGANATRTAPVGSYPEDASPYGCRDMAGNVWEWCADWYDAGYYAKSPAKNPEGPDDGELRVLRGGSWGSNSASLRTTFRHFEAPDLTYDDDGGFRCAVSETEAKALVGVARVKLAVDAKGSITNLSVLDAPNAPLKAAATAAARAWAVPKGKAATYTLKVTFGEDGKAAVAAG